MIVLWKVVKDVIAHVETGSHDAELFLHLLDMLAFAMSSHQWPSEAASAFKPVQIDSALIRRQVEAAFPKWGYYNQAIPVAEQISSAEISVADAIDDVADIIKDLKRAHWIYDNGCAAEAELELKSSYENHWRRHLRGLQFYVSHLETK